MSDEQFTEGNAVFNIPSLNTPCSTYFKIFGDLRNGLPPVVTVHGGPGSGHNYLLAFRNLWNRYRLPVIFYDSIGTGRSTHLQHLKGDTTFWTMELLVQDLDNLITRLQLSEGPGYFLLGHSVGGMISSSFASRRPKGLKKLVLANAPGSVDLHWLGLQLCAKELPEETQQAFSHAAETGDWKDQKYLDALAFLNTKNWCRVEHPEELRQSGQVKMQDRTVTDTMWGITPFHLTGTLKRWDGSSEWPNINVPTLLYHGEFDIERHEVVEPYVRHVPGIRKVTLERLSHMSHLEDEERVLELVGSFLLEG